MDANTVLVALLGTVDIKADVSLTTSIQRVSCTSLGNMSIFVSSHALCLLRPFTRDVCLKV